MNRKKNLPFNSIQNTVQIKSSFLMNLHFSYWFCVDGLSAVFEEKDCSKHQADNHQRDQNHPPNEYRVVDLEN